MKILPVSLTKTILSTPAATVKENVLHVESRRVVLVRTQVNAVSVNTDVCNLGKALFMAS